MPRFVALVFILLLTVSRGPALAAATVWQGKSLSSYLDSLNSAGLRIIYSSGLVPESLRIESEPGEITSELQLANFLQHYGLALREGPENSLLVTRPAESTAQTGSSAAPVEATPIPEIVVSASLHRLEYAAPGSYTSLTRELADRVPAASEEAVRLATHLPGVASDGLSARSHVRGGDENEVLFLYDGLRLYEPYHLKDFQNVATILNASAVAGMDYYTGAYPAQFGDRMSGVIDVDRRTPERDIETELALSFFNASVLSMGRFGGADQGDWLFTARRGNLDLIVDVVDPARGNPAYQDYQAHVGWEFGPRSRVSFNLLFSYDKLGLDDPQRGEQAGADYENQVAWIKWDADWSDNLSSQTHFAYTHIVNQRNGLLQMPGIVQGSLQEANDFAIAELKQGWRWILGDKLMWSFGLNLRDLEARYQFESARTLQAPFDTVLGNEPGFTRSYDLDPAGAQYAVHTELRWQPVSVLTLEAGLRWDQQNYTTASDDKQYSPRLGLLYQPSANTELRFGWGQFYQAQEINELQLSDGLTGYFPAQRSRHMVASVSHQLSADISVDVSIYDKRFSQVQPRFQNIFNTLTLLPELQFDRVAIDADQARARGAEILVSKGTSDSAIMWWFNYVWAVVEDEFADSKAKRSWDQTHTVKAGLSWRWRRWDFSAAAELHTGWPKTELYGELVPGPGGAPQLELTTGPYNDRRYTNLVRFDGRVSRDFAVRRGTLTTFLAITNLFDRSNPCCIEYSVANDGSLAGKEASWLPLLPSLGVIWRF